MESAKRFSSIPIHFCRRPSSPPPAAAVMPDADPLHPHAALWAQDNSIQNIKSLIPVTLDLKASNFSKWCNFLTIAVNQFALADHLEPAPPPADAEWLRMDSTVLRWLYGSINPDIADMVMAAGTTTVAVFAGITSLFRGNQQSRVGYLVQKFRNIVQGDKTVTAYCLEQKTVADALADVNASVSDDALVWNTIKGLNDHYMDIGNHAPLIKPFPTFLEFCNMLLLQELKPSSLSSTSPVVFYSAPANGGLAGDLHLHHHNRPVSVLRRHTNPWADAIHMYPMMGPGAPTHGHAGPVSILGPGPRPSAPLHHPPAQGYMALPAPSPPTPQATYSYTGYPAYGSSSAQTWDPSALASYFNTMSLQAPMEWIMDTGAAAHMSSEAGNLTSFSSTPPV
ncbi:uncharacterized protein [Aegilops tauschii subsp. strangulata]|uniref:uncharacterized protein n=1 Tax=Aegilops tauschii subsp. strangulata TaxID=200361 RepID=UPI00098A935C|nr:uncharacterized protein LOC109765948 [Aegilops tauschii subsp. strangulata]